MQNNKRDDAMINAGNQKLPAFTYKTCKLTCSGACFFLCIMF